MATSILYLDVDDEITSAASRIRSAEARRVAVVLPYGSRVATSRINFRLLARDALTHEKRLSIVAGDAATRALAASAGLPVFSTVGEYEGSAEGDGGPPTGSGAAAPAAAMATAMAGAAVLPGAGTGSVVEDPSVDTGATTVEGVVPAAAAVVALPPAARDRSGSRGPATAAGGSASVVRPVRVAVPSFGSMPRTPILVGLAVIGLVIVIGAVGAYLFLPSASVAISPREQTIGPVAFRVIADADATAPDVEAGVVPATVIDLPVEVADTFPATGKRVEEEPAKGTVRFDNLDFTSSNTIAKGAVVSTGSGVRFRTDRAVTVPPAELVGLTVVPSRASVKVTAVDEGPEGNVEPNAITNVPRGEEPLFLKVTNPDATSGGERTEFPRVTQDDVDAAVATLRAGLTGAFDDELADPGLGGGAVTVFPETAVLGDPSWSEDPAEIVGREAESFELGATAAGTVTAVDTAPVEAIAEERLASSVEAGHDLVPDSNKIDVSPGVVQEGVVSFPVTVTARQVARLDPAAIETEILGLPLADAQAILDGYGRADLQVWPDWVGTIPTFDGRVEVTIDSPVPTGSPGASESPP